VIAYVLDVLRRQRTVLAVSLLLAVAGTLTIYLRTSSSFQCDATLALPNITDDVSLGPGDPGAPQTVGKERTGAALSFYKRLNASIADLAILRQAFAEKLNDDDIRGLQSTLDTSVMPLSSSGRDALHRMERDDKIVAVRLHAEGRTSDEVGRVVETLAHVVRETTLFLATSIRVQQELQTATWNRSINGSKLVAFRVQGESLAAMAQDVDAIARGTGTTGGAREVVDVRGDSARFLPAPVQAMGLRTMRANTAHEARMAQFELGASTLKSAFYTELDKALLELRRTARFGTGQDAVSLFERHRNELAKRPRTPELELLLADVDAMVELLRVQRSAIQFDQYPTVRPVPRPRAAKLGVLLLFGLAVLVPFAWDVLAGPAREAATGPRPAQDRDVA
jgi:hypothetical protein